MPRSKDNLDDRYGISSEYVDLPCIVQKDTDFDDIMERVKIQAANQKDKEVRCDDLCLHSSGQGWDLAHNFQPIAHTSYALGQLLTYLKIPRPYFRRCPGHLKKENLNYWLRTKHNKRLIARQWNNIIRAFFSTRFTNEMDDVFVIPVVSKALRELTLSSHTINFTKTPGITRISIWFNEWKTREVEDIPWVLQGGLCITNSEIGLSSLRIQPYVKARDHWTGHVFLLGDYTAPGAKRFKHVGDMKHEAIAEALTVALKIAEDAVPVALNALMVPVERPREALEKVYHSNPFLTQTIMDSIADSLATQPEVLKGDIIVSILKACETVMPFQTKLHERIEAERGMAKYLGFLNGLEEQVGDILAEAMVRIY